MGHSSVVATVSYEDYVCLDASGDELPHGQKRHEFGETPSAPKANKRATVHIDGELKERLDAYGSDTYKEKINQLLNDADRVKTQEAKVIELERQLKAMSDFAVHPEVSDYDKGCGFSVQHDRGKVPIAEVIEWYVFTSKK